MTEQTYLRIMRYASIAGCVMLVLFLLSIIT